VSAEPGRDLQLALTFGQGNEPPVISAAFHEGAFNPFVPGTGYFEVDGVDAVGNVEAVILLVPMADTALGYLDRRLRFRGTPARHG
jgi:hypothetical protein